ncbi:expressed unknown protein [Seminavis robusta]|uniref:Uncharacterized protein n=1 Tax=Seminavis robusta TaxID=568900 RepID=A0A9N8DBT2_9STRA|nr:expressed unknown protein [Seminavis robusta]|eukprot:Sro27_g018210.1 n/a (554) ;mRNA; f:93825-95486
MSKENRVEKSKSALRSVANMIKMPSTSTSFSGSTDASKKQIDDVPLNAKVSKKASSSKSKTKVSPVQSTTVAGNKDLKLKVSHNDAGRVIISLSNPDRVLIQVQVDESVLKKRVLKKTKRVSDEKERPKKKVTVTKTKTRSSGTTTKVAAVEVGKPKKKSTHKKKPEKPRDLPEEETRKSKHKRTSSKSHDENTRPEHATSKSRHDNNIFAVPQQAPLVPMDMDSVASHHSSYSDDDSTRSPKDINRHSALSLTAPKTPKPSITSSMAQVNNTPEPSNVVPDNASVVTPSLDRRKQALMQFKRQSSGYFSAAPPTIGPEDDSLDRTALNDFMNTDGTEAKLEETASNDGGAMSTESGGGVFASPFQQRRLMQRQRRLERQRSSENEGAFRSTRSIRSGLSSQVDQQSSSQDTTSSGVGQFGMVVETKRTSHHAQQQQQQRRRNSTNSDGNKAKHTRTILSPDDEDSEAVTASNRIRATLAEVRKVELTNKGDARSGRSSFQGSYPRNRGDDTDNEHLVSDQGGEISSAKKWVTKICDKVCNNKRMRKDHQKLP